MIGVVQRVARARVSVDAAETGSIGRGLCVLLAVERGDTQDDADWMARKIAALRVFPDAAGRMNLDLSQVGGEVLLVSQFTLVADMSRGNRPGFDGAAQPDAARPLLARVAAALEGSGVRVAHGCFGAHMLVEIANDGPVTLVLRSPARAAGGRTPPPTAPQ